MVTTAGDRGARRRVRRRQRPGNTPELVGSALRSSRKASGLTLGEVHDRTGILWPQLEGLEAGDLSRFADRQAALVAVRRYADLVGVDAGRCAGVVAQYWGSALAGFSDDRGGSNGAGNGHAPVHHPPGTVGHLSRFPGDATHLRAFTQTAQVPGVRRLDPSVTATHGVIAATGTFPAFVETGASREPRRAPWILRATVWLTAFLLVVAGAGLAVHHWRPQWLKAIHLEKTTSGLPPAPSSGSSNTGASTPSSAIGTTGNTGGAKGGSARANNAVVTTTQSGPTSANVVVRAGSYSVVVLAWARCWVSVTTPQSFTPVYNNVLNAGQVQTFSSSEGQLTLNLGASLVTVQVKVGNKTEPWLFRPASAPFVLNLASASSSSA